METKATDMPTAPAEGLCRKLAARVVIPVVRWCTARMDRDDRHFDDKRPARFWGDPE